MGYRQATVWTCNLCLTNEYNDGDYIPSGWITLRVHNDRVTLEGTPDYHLCHNCVTKPVVNILESFIERY